MKVGIITYHASHNYGSMLLAFALQKSLEALGHEVKVINHRIIAQNFLYPNPVKFNRSIFLKELFHNPKLFFQNMRKWNRFESFSACYHNLTEKCGTLVEVEQIINQEGFDAVICGGDQIWNMQCVDFSIAYFLPFDIPNVKKISYSTSLGGGDVWNYNYYAYAIKGLIANFGFISVRETEASIFLSKIMHQQIPNVCDATLLLQTSDYNEVVNDKAIIKGDYVFYYTPYHNKIIEETSLKFAKSKGLKLVSSNGHYNQCSGMVRYNSAGPLEFLNLIKNAKYVCGMSFHLAVFACLFHKDFVLFSNSDSRMSNFLYTLGIEWHIYGNYSDTPNELPAICWKSVDEKIALMRKQGLDYLKTSLAISI